MIKIKPVFLITLFTIYSFGALGEYTRIDGTAIYFFEKEFDEKQALSPVSDKDNLEALDNFKKMIREKVESVDQTDLIRRQRKAFSSSFLCFALDAADA